MKRKYKIGLHVLIWIVVLLNDFLPRYLNNSYQSFIKKADSPGLLLDYLLVNLGYLVQGMIVFYSVAYLIAPLMLKHKKWPLGILYTVLLLGFTPACRYVMEFHFFLPYLDFDNYFGKTPETSWYIKNSISYMFYSYFTYGFVFFIISDRYKASRRQKDLEKEKSVAELAFLRSQINPHFLFNTLNDIYALTYQKADDAPHAVLKLAELLRYMLKESDDQLVPLTKEIIYLENVIELHKIGQKGASFVNFNIDGKIDDKKIPPLILINFVENAYKHGVFTNAETPIKIKITALEDKLLFSVSNQINHDVKDHTGGIGLHNVKRRLELIFPNKHQLVINSDLTTYNVKLQIDWI